MRKLKIDGPTLKKLNDLSISLKDVLPQIEMAQIIGGSCQGCPGGCAGICEVTCSQQCRDSCADTCSESCAFGFIPLPQM